MKGKWLRGKCKIGYQYARLETFLCVMDGVKGNTVIIGQAYIDLNVGNKYSSHYASLGPLRELLENG